METNITIGRNKNKHLKIDLKNYPNILITGLDDYSKSDLVSNILYELISKNKKEEIKSQGDGLSLVNLRHGFLIFNGSIFL